MTGSHRHVLCATLTAICTLGFHASPVCAQCQPAWDVAIGTPGINDGYVDPVTTWTDNAIYVGGSFSRIDNHTYKLISRYDPATQTWSKLGNGLTTGNTNGFVTTITPFNTGTEDLLVVGGFFEAQGVEGTRSLAAWDGATWRALGTDFVSPDAVWGMTVGDLGDGTKLYICGSFTHVGNQPASGVAAWDGTHWTVLGDGLGMTGFSPFVNEITIFDDGSGPALYAAGRFDSIDGVNAKLAARYRPGTGWEKIGVGVVKESSTTTLDGMTIFDDGNGPALYIAGSPFRPANQGGFVSVLKWDGNDWSKIGQNVGGRVTSLVVFDDGTGEALYLSGTATPGINYLAKYDGSQWVPYLGGVSGPAIPPSNFPSVFGLSVIRGDLYVAGNYSHTGDDQPCAGISVIRSCANACLADWDHDGDTDTADFIAYLNDWTAQRTMDCSTNQCSADLDGDGVIETQDFIAFLNAWVLGC